MGASKSELEYYKKKYPEYFWHIWKGGNSLLGNKLILVHGKVLLGCSKDQWQERMKLFVSALNGNAKVIISVDENMAFPETKEESYGQRVAHTKMRLRAALMLREQQLRCIHTETLEEIQPETKSVPNCFFGEVPRVAPHMQIQIQNWDAVLR